MWNKGDWQEREAFSLDPCRSDAQESHVVLELNWSRVPWGITPLATKKTIEKIILILLQSMGVSKNGWFIMENPMKIGMMTGGTPLSENLHMPAMVPYTSQGRASRCSPS